MITPNEELTDRFLVVIEKVERIAHRIDPDTVHLRIGGCGVKGRWSDFPIAVTCDECKERAANG